MISGCFEPLPGPSGLYSGKPEISHFFPVGSGALELSGGVLSRIALTEPSNNDVRTCFDRKYQSRMSHAAWKNGRPEAIFRKYEVTLPAKRSDPGFFGQNGDIGGALELSGDVLSRIALTEPSNNDVRTCFDRKYHSRMSHAA